MRIWNNGGMKWKTNIKKDLLMIQVVVWNIMENQSQERLKASQNGESGNTHIRESMKLQGNIRMDHMRMSISGIIEQPILIHDD